MIKSLAVIITICHKSGMARPEKTHPLYFWRKQHSTTLHALASDLDVTQTHLSEVENWNRTPSLDLASRLHRKTGIPMEKFVKPQETAA